MRFPRANRRQYMMQNRSGAPRSMKMGATVSPMTSYAMARKAIRAGLRLRRGAMLTHRRPQLVSRHAAPHVIGCGKDTIRLAVLVDRQSATGPNHL
jgi:hypothetical protein